MMKVNPKVLSAKTLGLRLQEVLMRNHVVMRKERNPPTDNKSDQEMGKGRDTQVITDTTMMGSGYRSDIELSP